MRTFARSALTALLVAVALSLTACGQTQGGDSQGGGESSDAGRTETTARTGMSGMQQGMEGTTGGMSGMEMGSGETAPAMLVQDGEYSDERFLDMMVPHHMMAVQQAEVARKNAEHPEIRQLAEQITATQREEIDELKSVKEDEFGTRQTPTMMAPEGMANTGMTMGEDLETADPFDRAFIDSMIPHHASAIETATVAYNESDNPVIREIARGIIDSQANEVGQMIEWREKWYPES